MLGILVTSATKSDITILALLTIPLIVSAVENISVWGIDNALVSLAVVGLFAAFKIS